MRIFTKIILVLLVSLIVINPAIAEEFIESPNLKVIMELANTVEAPQTNFKKGDVVKVSGYVEENHGLTKVGNVSIDFFIEWPNGDKIIIAEDVLTDENGSFVISIWLTDDYVIGKYSLTADPTGSGYQKQLNIDKQSLQFYLVEVSDGLLQSPLKQFKSGVLLNEIQCKKNLVFGLKNNGNPICVKPYSIHQLGLRGYTLSTSCTNTLFLQNDSMILNCGCKNNEYMISGGYHIGIDSNIEIKSSQRKMLTNGLDVWEVEFFNPVDRSEFAYVYTYCKEK